MYSDKIKELTNIVEKEFGGLSPTQLNWSPSTWWSIGQCLDHLIISNRLYLPALRRIATDDYRPTFWEKFNPMTQYTGRKMVKTLGPVIIRKYKSPLAYTPGKSVDQNIIPDFKKLQEEIAQLFISIESGNKKERIITSPIAPLITLKTEDVIQIIIGHEERHIQQALRLKNLELFPG